MCSGAIVSPWNVLTTSTCINNISPPDIRVYVGSVKYYADGYTSYVQYYLQHPNFNSANYDYNIAILRVVSPFDLNIVQPIPLASVEPATNTVVIASAYGAINSNLDLPDVLQKASLAKYSFTVCQQRKNNKLTASMFCAGDPNGKRDTCAADQGAPAVYQDQLVGIYSWGASCGLAASNPSSPVFTSIPFLKSWILSNIWL